MSKTNLHLKEKLQQIKKEAEKKYVNVDFFEWLKNKQIQTGLILQD